MYSLLAIPYWCPISNGLQRSPLLPQASAVLAPSGPRCLLAGSGRAAPRSNNGIYSKDNIIDI